jgi:hypothetical protein
MALQQVGTALHNHVMLAAAVPDWFAQLWPQNNWQCWLLYCPLYWPRFWVMLAVGS